MTETAAYGEPLYSGPKMEYEAAACLGSELDGLGTDQMRSTEECGGKINGGEEKWAGAVASEMKTRFTRTAGFNSTSAWAKPIRLSNSRAEWSQWHEFECASGAENWKPALEEL